MKSFWTFEYELQEPAPRREMAPPVLVHPITKNQALCAPKPPKSMPHKEKSIPAQAHGDDTQLITIIAKKHARG